MRPTPPPDPPYHVVVFVSRRSNEDPAYAGMAEEMAALAAEQDGYLGHDSARDAAGFGITVSYWRDAAAVTAWKAAARHRVAQRLGARGWYSAYAVHVARVERAYLGPRLPA